MHGQAKIMKLSKTSNQLPSAKFAKQSKYSQKVLKDEGWDLED